MHTWDPDRYLTYADERGRPFVELMARVGAEAPRTVVDLGCGPGNLTRLLALRWPGAEVVGLDSSEDMVARASRVEGVSAQVADIREWATGATAAEPEYAAYTSGVAVPSSHDPATYLETIAAQGWQVDAWETTYLHVLRGPDPVFAWVSGTGARPTLQALPAELGARFGEEFRRRLREAYPDRGHGVVLPFRRVFAVAHR